MGPGERRGGQVGRDSVRVAPCGMQLCQPVTLAFGHGHTAPGHDFRGSVEHPLEVLHFHGGGAGIVPTERREVFGGEPGIKYGTAFFLLIADANNREGHRHSKKKVKEA